MSTLAALSVLIPIGIASAFSTVPILVTIALLLSARGRIVTIPFLIGWAGGLFVFSGAFALGLAAAMPRFSFGGAPTLVMAGELILGALLLAFGAFVISRKPAEKKPNQPSWTRHLEGIGLFTALGLGLVLNLRPKALLLAAGAGLAIGSADLGTSEFVITLLVYTAIGASSVALPIIFTLARPATMEPRLRAVRDWLGRNQRFVTGGVMLAVGLVLAVAGLIQLLQ